jgi:predicted amidohydrolase YtcJ
LTKKTITEDFVLMTSSVIFKRENNYRKIMNIDTENSNAVSEEKADTIYCGGDIVTMVDAEPQAEALAIQGDKILAVGTQKHVMTFKGANTKEIDLCGRTMLPGLIDPHSHVTLTAAKLWGANISPPPIGSVTSHSELKRVLFDYLQERKIKPGDWIYGMGYDDTSMAEQRHPDRALLDEVSKENPIILSHISGHVLAANSLALKLAGIDHTVQNPEGGVIQRVDGTNEPNGVLEETAIRLIFGAVPMPGKERIADELAKAVAYYVKHGITTAQDGAIKFPIIQEIFSRMGKDGRLTIDVVGYPYHEVAEQMLGDYVNDTVYHDHFRLGGMKMVLDGSIQAFTAYLSKPYHVDLGIGETEEGQYRGYPMIESQDEVDTQVMDAYRNNWPLLCHTNGDAATDMLLSAVQKAENAYPGKDRRTVIIHAQTMREDQLGLAAKLGMIPSFFPAHVYYWGDRHRDLFLGPDRGARINPLKSALDRRMVFTGHHDCPVTPVDMMMIIWAAANRVTSGGKKLGPEQCIPVYEALKMVTINAAYQYFEEEKKGTLECGKLADLVILSDNPLKIDPMAIKDIMVLETIKEGATVYQKTD